MREVDVERNGYVGEGADCVDKKICCCLLQ
jgi:hypothetical protein